MGAAEWLGWREAWTRALYGAGGFYTREQPSAHFRTSPQVSALFADAVATLARRHGLDAVWDLGAGAGELATQLAERHHDLTVTAVEIRPKARDVPERVDWRAQPAAGLRALLFANELLDNLPCDVAEVDDDGRWRLVEVQPSSMAERLGPSPDPDALQWLERWWPAGLPGQRAEVGLTRDRWWEAVCSANPASVCVAVDYGHLAGERPPDGSLTSYQGGRQRPVRLDGRHDVTAGVAMDALHEAVGGRLVRQRDVLLELGVRTERPPIELAHADPSAYVRRLAGAGEAGELVAAGGLGDHIWSISGPDGSR